MCSLCMGIGCLHVSVWRGMDTCGSQSLTSGVFLDHSPPYFLSSGFSLNLELNDLVTPAGHQIPRIAPRFPS